MESVPQVLVLLVLWGYDAEMISDKSLEEWSLLPTKKSVFFMITFTCSVLSASHGIGCFLLYGPCQVLPQTGLLNGALRMGYFILFANVCLSWVSKGIVFTVMWQPPYDILYKFLFKVCTTSSTFGVTRHISFKKSRSQCTTHSQTIKTP